MKYFLLLGLGLTLGSWAKDCAQDVTKLCQGIEPGPGEITKCLSDHANQLSRACFTELKVKKKTEELNPCFENLAAFCPEIPHAKIDYCLMKNEIKLTPKCLSSFKAKKARLMIHDVCATELVQNCYVTLPASEASSMRCLIKHQSTLSPSCAKDIENKVAKLKMKNACYAETEKFCSTLDRPADIQECLEQKITSLSGECKKSVQEEQKKATVNPCYKEVLRHCRPGLSLDDQHLCLDKVEISLACKQHRSEVKEKTKKLMEICEPDRLKICHMARFQTAAIKCLRDNKTRLTKHCAKLL